MDKKFVGIKTTKNEIHILLFITNDCNYTCPYCIAKDRGSEYIKMSDVLRVREFIITLLDTYKDKNIVLVYTGGEPTIHSELVQMVETILNIDNERLSISVLTNGNILYTKENELEKLIQNNFKSKLDFSISYHYFDDMKDGFSNYVKSVNMLRKLGIKFEVNYLIPYWKSADFSAELIEKLKKEIGDVYIKYILVSQYSVIDEQNPRNNKYNEGHYKLAERNTKAQENLLELIFDNGTKRTSLMANAKYVSSNKLDNFYGWRCYPFKNLSTMIIGTDCMVSIAGCHSFTKTSYTLDSMLEFMKEKNFYINCGSKICRASMNYGLEKEIEENTGNDISFENSLEEIIKKVFVMKDFTFVRTKYINNGFNIISVIFMFKYNKNPEIILHIGIEKILNDKEKYLYRYKDFGFHYFTRALKGRYIYNEEVNSIIQKINIVSKLKFITEIIIKLLDKKGENNFLLIHSNSN